MLDLEGWNVRSLELECWNLTVKCWSQHYKYDETKLSKTLVLNEVFLDCLKECWNSVTRGSPIIRISKQEPWSKDFWSCPQKCARGLMRAGKFLVLFAVREERGLFLCFPLSSIWRWNFSSKCRLTAQRRTHLYIKGLSTFYHVPFL